MRRIVIYGLGLIGGSIAQALRHSPTAGPAQLVGIDVSEVLSSNEARACVDELVDVSDVNAVARALGASELAVLAAPVRVIERVLPATLAACPAVTDCGSTKRSILSVAAASPHASRFVGGHPMAGSPEGGLSNARPDLFQGSRWILCPDAPRTAEQALARVRRLISDVGASAVELTAEEHDRAVALTSHLPQLLASALAVLAHESGADAAAGPAFASATRVAGGPEIMWRDILETNADAIPAAVAALTARLDGIGRALPDVGPALELLAEARARRSVE